MVVVRVTVSWVRSLHVVDVLFGHGVFELVAECLQCCLVGRRVGVGCVEGLFLVFLVSVHRVFVPVDSAVSFSLAVLLVELRGR